MANWGSWRHAALLLGKPAVQADETRLRHTCRPCTERLTDMLTRRIRDPKPPPDCSEQSASYV